MADLRDGSASWPTTSWTLVIAARERHTPVGQQALNELCRRYASPVYAYVRRRGHNTDDAADLTQDFFAQLLSRDGLAKVEPEGGRFRSLLRVASTVTSPATTARAPKKKRGGESNPVSFRGGQGGKCGTFFQTAPKRTRSGDLRPRRRATWVENTSERFAKTG